MRILWCHSEEPEWEKNGMQHAILHGRWGVAQECNCRSILTAIASLLEAQRPDLAMILIEQELNSQT